MWPAVEALTTYRIGEANGAGFSEALRERAARAAMKIGDEEARSLVLAAIPGPPCRRDSYRVDGDTLWSFGAGFRVSPVPREREPTDMDANPISKDPRVARAELRSLLSDVRRRARSRHKIP